jgi:integrase/recombinase XerD
MNTLEKIALLIRQEEVATRPLHIRTRTLLADFLVSRQAKDLSRKTISWYKQMLTGFAVVHSELPLEPGLVEQFLICLDRSKETKRAYFRALHAFYRWASKRYHFPNPMEELEAPPPDKKPRYSLSVLDAGWLMATPLSPRDHALLTLLLDTGIRAGEAVGLDRSDIQAETIRVFGKTGVREVPLSQETKEQLLALGTDPVFQGSKGRLTRSGAYRVVRLALARAGITARKHGPHTLRHTFGRQYLMNGGDLESLRKILGHTDIKTTRIYADLDLRDVTHQHHLYTPLKQALAGAQAMFWSDQAAARSAADAAAGG